MSEGLLIAKAVASGDKAVCKKFVHDYSPLVLSRVRQLMRGHCHHSPADHLCCLLVLQRQLQGAVPAGSLDGQCDDCMDSYLWFFDFLKGRVKSFQGKNNCSLKTFVWALLQSRTTYLDWLRWRYGRAF